MTDGSDEEIMHIASPIAQPSGRPNICDAEQTIWNAFSGLDEAYKAYVEVWTNRQKCKDCLKVALVAMEVTP